MVKRYILDTSVLLHDPRALYNFQEHEVYLLREVINESDRFKRGMDDKNANAREVSRTIDDLIKDGIPAQGIPLGEEDGKLFFLSEPIVEELKYNSLTEQKIVETLEQLLQIAQNHFGYNDDVILQRAQRLQRENPEKQVVIVTKDTNLRIRAKTLGLQAEDYRHDKASIDLHAFFRKGSDILEVPKLLIDQLHSKKFSPLPDYFIEVNNGEKVTENQYFILKAESQSVLVKYKKGNLQMMYIREKVEDIKPRNHGQRFLLDACLDKDIGIVSALGKAGTGKTLIALAAGIHQVTEGEDRRYDKVVVFRPMMQVGRDLGFLPGDIDDKIGPYFKSVDSALKIILSDAAADYAKYSNLIDCQPITFERGNTIYNSYIIIDEAQNFTPKELQLLGSRVGSGSKIIVIGDPFQIDNPYLDEKSNGLTVMTDHYRGKVSEFAYVILDKGERSRIAEIFADYM